MSRYRLDFLESLARQMAFVPAGVREKQLQAAEALLLSIDPAKAYPPAYIVFRITDYRPEVPPTDQATGLALQHDLGLLIERVSMTLDDCTVNRAEPVLQIDDLVQQFNVTSKTIQRWRRRGLAARRFMFPDGKRRVGFRLGVVEQFFAAHRQSLAPTINCTRIADDEWSIIRRHTRRLCKDTRRPVDEIAARVGRLVGRTALAIEAELRKHDAEHPDNAFLTGRPAAASAAAVEGVQRLAGDGLPFARIATLLGLPRSTTFRLVLADRMARAIGRRIKFLDDPLYHQDDAAEVMDALVAQEPLGSDVASPPPMRGLSPELASLCSHKVLSPTQERALFLQFNFRKFQAAQARHRLDPARIRRRDLTHIDRLLERATDVRNRIVRANLRLVVSVAKKHVRPGITLPELANEGSLTLMRAVESFDTRRGNKFSTYATLALMKGFARTTGRLGTGMVVSGLGERADRVADTGRCGIDHVDRVDRINHLLRPLASDERAAVCRQFELTSEDPDPSDSFDGPTLRRLQRTAIVKLRSKSV
ncbi:MAG: polymerase sigma factor, sigma-70 family [Phycisphaerales bacterium]|nr:polymerase sigma factor, sigma-70 family [Phycisphaerales bacterium]